MEIKCYTYGMMIFFFFNQIRGRVSSKMCQIHSDILDLFLVVQVNMERLCCIRTASFALD